MCLFTTLHLVPTVHSGTLSCTCTDIIPKKQFLEYQKTVLDKEPIIDTVYLH